MQELEKILEEIGSEFDRRINTQLKIMAGLGDDVYRYGYGKSLEAYQQGKLLVTEIIRNHMNDGWISVEERLPEEVDSMLYIVTDKYGCVYGEMCYGASEDGDTVSFYQWDDDMWRCYKPEVIAWQPMPEPYRPERSDNYDGE